MIKNYFAIFALFFSVMPLTFAWNATGHKLVAQLAYQQLDEQTREQVDNILGDQFINASVWADQVRAKGNETMNTWHYINLPNPGPQKNVVDAINDDLAVWRNPKATQAEKNQALRGLIHWVADVHQPLHTIGRDRGGNSFYLAQNPYGKNLHQLWDNGAGALYNIKNLQQTAQEWQQAYPPTEQELAQTNPMQWAEAGYKLATTQAYVGITPKGTPSPNYIARTQAITKSQIVLAGVRLAQLL
jgi:hypothetical protein